MKNKKHNVFIPLLATFGGLIGGLIIVSFIILSTFALNDFLIDKYPNIEFLIYVYIFFMFCICLKFTCIPDKLNIGG